MAELAQQTQIEVVDEVGKLAKVTEALKRAGVNIRAAVAWVEGANGHMRMVTDDNDKACQAVGDLVTACGTNEVVCVSLPDEVGSLNKLAAKLAGAGIGINLFYASAAAGKVLVVLETTDNARALRLV